MSTDSEVRGSRLAQRVEEIEKLIRSGAVATGTSLASLLDSAQAQLDANRLEEEHLLKDKKEQEQKDRSAITAMVERETKLNEEEKKKYSEFLAKDYFTRSDFGDLSKFYADGGAYDRLSNAGKAQMSNRIEEGIHQGELIREELPENVNRKNEEFRNSSPPKAKGTSETEKTGLGSDRPESSKVENSVPDVSKAGHDTVTSELAAKANSANGLAGLSSLSPVKETDNVVVPQTEIGGESRVR